MWSHISHVDRHGNLWLPEPSLFRRSPPPSPPWGNTSTKTSYVNFPFKLKPVGVPPITLQGKTNLETVLLCTLVPCLNQKVQEHHQKRKQFRASLIRQRTRPLKSKLVRIDAKKQRHLKRLQSRPLLLAKKREVFKKWEDRSVRRSFRRRRRQQLAPSSQYSNDSESQCRLWTCHKPRRSRRDIPRRSTLSQLSLRSQRSRSPIIIRPVFH